MLFKVRTNIEYDFEWWMGTEYTTHLEDDARIYDTNNTEDMENVNRDFDYYDHKIHKVGD